MGSCIIYRQVIIFYISSTNQHSRSNRQIEGKPNPNPIPKPKAVGAQLERKAAYGQPTT